jgi:hypothetical protein
MMNIGPGCAVLPRLLLNIVNRVFSLLTRAGYVWVTSLLQFMSCSHKGLWVSFSIAELSFAPLEAEHLLR